MEKVHVDLEVNRLHYCIHLLNVTARARIRMASTVATVHLIIAVAVVVLSSFCSSFPLNNHTESQITNKMLHSRHPRSLSSFDLFTLPCQHGDRKSRILGYRQDPRILLRKMERIMNRFDHCYGYNNMAVEFLEPTKFSPKNCDDEGKAEAHKAAITLQILSHYLKQFQMRNYQSFYNHMDEFMRHFSCSLLDGGFGLQEADLLPFVRLQLANLPEDEPSDTKATLFCNYHSTFAKAALRSLNVWKRFYDKNCIQESQDSSEQQW